MRLRLPAPRRTAHDDGAVLILALVFITVFAVLAIAVIQFAGTSIRRTAVVRDRVEKTAAANAGIRYTIEQLGIDPTTCAQPGNQAPGGATVRLPTLVLDRDVDVTCAWAGGLPSGVNGWAMAITGENLSASRPLVETQGGTDPKPVVGPVFLDSPDPNRYDLKKPITIELGNVVIRQPACTSPTVDPSGGDFDITSPSPPYGFDCTTLTWPELITLPTLPATPPPEPLDRDPVAPGNQFFRDEAGCRIFYPGTYNGAATMPLGSGPVYLASGVYYLNGFGRFVIDNAFIGGQPGPTDTFVMRDDAGSCASVSDSDATIAGAPGVGGTGVTLILGGSGPAATRIALEKGQLELFRRTTTNPDDPLTNVSVVSVPPGTPGWPAHEPAQDALVFETKPGNKTDNTIHGAWITPRGGVEFGNVTGKSTEGQFLGGLVASRAILQSSASVAPGSFIIRTDVGPFTRDLVLRARALGTKSDVVATVVLSVSNESGRPVAVRSWRLATE